MDSSHGSARLLDVPGTPRSQYANRDLLTARSRRASSTWPTPLGSAVAPASPSPHVVRALTQRTTPRMGAARRGLHPTRADVDQSRRLAGRSAPVGAVTGTGPAVRRGTRVDHSGDAVVDRHGDGRARRPRHRPPRRRHPRDNRRHGWVATCAPSPPPGGSYGCPSGPSRRSVATAPQTPPVSAADPRCTTWCRAAKPAQCTRPVVHDFHLPPSGGVSLSSPVGSYSPSERASAPAKSNLPTKRDKPALAAHRAPTGRPTARRWTRRDHARPGPRPHRRHLRRTHRQPASTPTCGQHARSTTSSTPTCAPEG